MEGVVATLHNGTSLFTTGDALEIDFLGGQVNFTYNATGYQSVFIKFSADKQPRGKSYFAADVGLRPFEKDDDDDNDNEDNGDDNKKAPISFARAIPISKELTFNEEVVILVFLLGIIAMCCKNRHCYDGWSSFWCCCGLCKRIKHEPSHVEKEFYFKVRRKKYDFNVNLKDEDTIKDTSKTNTKQLALSKSKDAEQGEQGNGSEDESVYVQINEKFVELAVS